MVSGHRSLCGFIGDPVQRQNFVLQKVNNCSDFGCHGIKSAPGSSCCPYKILTIRMEVYHEGVNVGCNVLMNDLKHCLSSVFFHLCSVLK